MKCALSHELRLTHLSGAAALACGPVHGPLPPSFPALLRGEPGALLVHYGALAGRVVRAEQDHHRAKDPRGGDLGLQEDDSSLRARLKRFAPSGFRSCPGFPEESRCN